MFYAVVKPKRTNESRNIEDAIQNKSEFQKIPFFGYVSYVSSIYTQLVADFGILLILAITLAVYIGKMVESQRSMISTYDDITNLQGQTQTAAVIAETNEKYVDLKDEGDEWKSEYRA